MVAAGRQPSRSLRAGLALAEPKAPFEPRVGQSGKDVIWVPTAQALVDRMLDLAQVTPSDLLMDLGSGDGRTVITAAKRGTRAIGVEYNPDMVELSRRNAKEADVSERATFMQADLFATDFSKATVVTMFLLPSINLKLRPKILDMRPGTRVVSNSFDMGDWRPEQTIEAPERLHELLPRASVDRAGQGRRHLEAAGRRFAAGADLPDAARHASAPRIRPSTSSTAKSSATPSRSWPATPATSAA